MDKKVLWILKIIFFFFFLRVGTVDVNLAGYCNPVILQQANFAATVKINVIAV